MKSKHLPLFFSFLLFAALNGFAQTNLVKNPSFELGPVVTSISQIHKATDWSNNPCLPAGTCDLYDRFSTDCYYSVPGNQWGSSLPPNIPSENRYAGFWGMTSAGSYAGESLYGTLNTPLSAGFYEISLQAMTVNVIHNCSGVPNPPSTINISDHVLEIRLRKNGSCATSKLVYTTPVISNIGSWAKFCSSFTLSPSDALVGYDRIEIKVRNTSSTSLQNFLVDEIFIGKAEIGLSDDQSFICTGTGLDISLSGAQSYSWSPTTGITQLGPSSFHVEPLVPTTYTITGTTSCGTLITKTVSYTINTPVPPGGSLFQIIPDHVDCGATASLMAIQGNYTYLWSTGASTHNIQINEPGTYTVTIEDANGCKYSEQVIIPGKVCCERDPVYHQFDYTGISESRYHCNSLRKTSSGDIFALFAGDDASFKIMKMDADGRFLGGAANAYILPGHLNAGESPDFELFGDSGVVISNSDRKVHLSYFPQSTGIIARDVLLFRSELLDHLYVYAIKKLNTTFVLAGVLRDNFNGTSDPVLIFTDFQGNVLSSQIYSNFSSTSDAAIEVIPYNDVNQGNPPNKLVVIVEDTTSAGSGNIKTRLLFTDTWGYPTGNTIILPTNYRVNDLCLSIDPSGSYADGFLFTGSVLNPANEKATKLIVGKLDIGGGLMWMKQQNNRGIVFEGLGILQENNGDISMYTLARTNSGGNDKFYPYMSQLSSSGTHLRTIRLNKHFASGTPGLNNDFGCYSPGWRGYSTTNMYYPRNLLLNSAQGGLIAMGDDTHNNGHPSFTRSYFIVKTQPQLDNLCKVGSSIALKADNSDLDYESATNTSFTFSNKQVFDFGKIDYNIPPERECCVNLPEIGDPITGGDTCDYVSTEHINIDISFAGSQFGGKTTLNLNVTSSDPNKPLGFLAIWDFGDGTFGGGHSTTHTYNSFGQVTVCVTVEVGSGCYRTICKTFNICDLIPAPVITATVNNGVATFTLPPWDYYFSAIGATINWGDGTVTPITFPLTSAEFQHEYVGTGFRLICFSITLPNGCVKFVCTGIFIMPNWGFMQGELPDDNSRGTTVPLEGADFSVRPNPFNTELSFLYTVQQESAGLQYRISVEDITGRTVMGNEQSYSFNREHEIDLSKLPTGTYLIKAYYQDQVVSKLIIKQ